MQSTWQKFFTDAKCVKIEDVYKTKHTASILNFLTGPLRWYRNNSY